MTTATAGTTSGKKKKDFISYLRMSQLCKSAQYAYRSKNLLRLNICTHSVQLLKKIPKISHCGSRSPKYIELGHFTLLFFCRGRQRNIQRFKTQLYSYFAHKGPSKRGHKCFPVCPRATFLVDTNCVRDTKKCF